MKSKEKAKETSTLLGRSECIKICGKCGKEWKEVLFRARTLSEGTKLDGFYWECECKSTLFVQQSFMSRRAIQLMSNVTCQASLMPAEDPDYEEHG